MIVNAMAISKFWSNDQLNAVAFTIIGVAPPEFTGPAYRRSFRIIGRRFPCRRNLPRTQSRLERFQPLKRLRFWQGSSPSITLAQAQEQTDRLIRQYDATLNESDRTDRTTGITLQHAVFSVEMDDPRFQAAAAGLDAAGELDTGCGVRQYRNMLLARGAARQREIGRPHGAGFQPVPDHQQLLAESFLLSAIGGAAGLVLAMWTSRTLGIRLQQLLISRGGTASK